MRQDVRRGPLAGVRVLDVTGVMMGPLCTQILGDQGADVILVDKPAGDTNRHIGKGPHQDIRGVTLNLLRNKRSVSLDLRQAKDLERLHRLASTCDVVVTALRPSVVERHGLDYESLRELRSDVIVCQAQGYPLSSPERDVPAYDDIIQAACGIPELVERVTGDKGLLPTIFADKVCGLVMAQAITAALLHRERTGEGQHIEVPMVQATSAFILAEHGAGAIPEPPYPESDGVATGYFRVLTAERRPAPTKDGWIHVFPYLPHHYRAFFAEVGGPGADISFESPEDAVTNSPQLYGVVRGFLSSRTTAEWVAFCDKAGIPCTPVRSLQDVVDDLTLIEHPVTGMYRYIPQMANFSATPGGLRRHAPLIGEHNDEVFTELDAAIPE